MQVNELIGQWMSKFGHAIRNTRGGPFHVNTARGTGGYLAPKVPEDLLRDAGPNNVQITSTCRGNTIWLHILQGAGQPLVLPPVPARILKHQSLNSGAFTVKQTDQGIEIALQEGKPDALDTILELEFDGEAFAIEPVFGLAGRGAK
jgi:alpha-L-fucosidase